MPGRAEALPRALAAVDPARVAGDAAALVRVPSVTGRERPALERLAELAAGYGLEAELAVHDLAAVRAAAGYPGEEAPRTELAGLQVRLPGAGAGRLCLCGHLDVVGPGAGWARDPWSGAIEGGHVHGRGAVDMKGGVAAALHALAALRAAGAVPPAEVVLLAVASEEDGGLGAFAALERDSAWDACLIPEPTGFRVVCAHAGALTFAGVVRGRAAHAALRRAGVSAIDRYLAVHAALRAHEGRLNRDVEHPLMRRLELPYPLEVGRLAAGRWSSSVPDRLEFEGRLGVRLGEDPGAARRGLEAALARADDGVGPPVELRWTGGQFASAETPPDAPFPRAVRAAAARELGREPELAGVPWGADMRLFSARRIPTVMLGPSGTERAHAVDERVAVDELGVLARILVRVALGFAAA